MNNLHDLNDLSDALKWDGLGSFRQRALFLPFEPFEVNI